jgi:hypothetical protein
MSKTFGAGVRVAAFGLAAATALTFSGPVFAGENAAASPGAPAAKRPQGPVSAPSPALLAGIQEMIKRVPAATSVREWPDGTLGLQLGSSFLNVLVAQAQTDGSFRAMCVAATDTTKALAAPAPRPAFEEK